MTITPSEVVHDIITKTNRAIHDFYLWNGEELEESLAHGGGEFDALAVDLLAKGR